ncbi:MAG: hypothetical protein M1281_10215 [Chloroflexi bacterium]|nr:hypothetical protein [Chloroflexota bacterium]
MKRILWGFLFLFALTSLAAFSSLVILSAYGPFHPGQGEFYTAQRWVEQTLVDLDRRPAGKAHHLIDIAARRARDLSRLSGTPQEQLALDELEQAVFQAVNASAHADSNDSVALRGQLLKVLEKSHTAMLGLKSVSNQNSQHLSAFWNWLVVVTRLVQNANLPLGALIQSAGVNLPSTNLPVSAGSQTAQPHPTQTAAEITPQPVTFPPGSPGAEHAFFPLDGQHAALSCFACHPGGRYAGAPKLCSDCHAKDLPSIHYPGECSTCHNADNWRDASYDHSLAQAADCSYCHLRLQPDGHYKAQCSACHSVQAWNPASFNHAAIGATNCQSCHSQDQPSGHYNAQCSACHNNKEWKPASFNHTAVEATNCQSCHSQSTPDNHYSGQCSACHKTSGWKPASFDHAAAGATDCQSCHSSNRPSSHYAGQCSACHKTSGWKPAGFDHAAAGATDCQSCHSNDQPSNHYAGQCSSCHNTTSWQQASFSHTFPQDHGGANGQCATCHPSGTDTWTCFNCHNQDDMNNKHHDISGYTTNCIACHPKGNGDD